MSGSTSLVRRVAWGAAVAASAAALVSAFATIAFASYLVGRAEDLRLEEAAVTFAAELGHAGANLEAVREVHRDESAEMGHTGMIFAVYDPQGSLLVGDHRLALPTDPGCATGNADTLRACHARTASGLTAVVGASHGTLLPWLAGAAILAALLAATLAWVVSRPISRHVVAPLTRLRERIAVLDVDDISQADLGPDEAVVEVDALRRTIGQLVTRVEMALSHAHRFAANAAHELRTPLTSVSAELELLSESMSEPSARADALRAHTRLADLLVLVERLLVLSTPTRTSTDAHEIVSVRDLVEDVVGELSAADRKRVGMSETDALVRGDAVLLGSMVANAIANALKFGSAVRIGVSVSGEFAIICVDDDGPGITGADRERVFDPFFRTDDALQRRLPGHGLGLALVRHVAEMHGGHASFASKATHGARLEMRVRAADSTSPT